MKYLLVVALVVGSCFAADKTEYLLYSRADCVHCERLKEKLEKLGIKTVDAIHNQYDGVTGYPTLVVIVNGVERERIVGNVPVEVLTQKLVVQIDTCKPSAQLPVGKRVEAVNTGECEVCKRNAWATTHVILDGKPVLKEEIQK